MNDKDMQSRSRKKDLRISKGCYFSQYGCMGCFVPYMSLFLISIGLSLPQVGLIIGIRQIFAALSAFMTGLLIDTIGRKKLIAMLLVMLNMIAIISVPYILFPFYKQSMDNNVMMNGTEQNIAIINKFGGGNLSTYNDANGLRNITEPSHRDDNLTLFSFTLFWYCLISITGLPLLPIVDSSVVRVVKHSKKKATYGMQRLFAPIGFTVGSILSGVCIDLYQPGNGLNKYTSAFICIIPFFVMFFICLLFLKMTFSKDEIKSKIKNEHTMVTLFNSCKNVSFTLFLVTLFVIGFTFNIIQSYLLLLMEEMNASKTLMGITFSMSTIGEILIFPFANKIMKLLGGSYVCFCVAVLSYAIRFFVFYISTQPWHILIAQLLHAFGHGLFWVAAIEYTYNYSKPQIAQSLFSLVNIVFYMVASIIANLCGGVLYKMIGGRYIFMSLSILCTFWGVILIIYYILFERFYTVQKRIEDEIFDNKDKLLDENT